MRHEGTVGGAAFSPDQQRVLTWSRDGTARLWDAATGQQQGPALRHEGTVGGAAFSPDQRRVLTWSEGTARLWDIGDDIDLLPVLFKLQAQATTGYAFN